MDWFINLNVIMQAFLAATFTFLITSLGSAFTWSFGRYNVSSFLFFTTCPGNKSGN